MKPDQQRVCDVVMETVIKLCASGLEGSTARVQGVIGVTVDDSDVFVIHINDMVRNLSAGGMAPSHCHKQQDMSPVPVSPPVVSASPAGCSSARKRARHRLVFESPDVCRQRRNDLTELERYRRLTQACGEAIHSKVKGSLSQVEPVNNTDYSSDLKQSTGVIHDQAPAAKSSVVVVDSDDEDVKLVTDQNMSVLSPKHAVCEESMMNVTKRENYADPACAANTVGNLCIADVVGSVSSWSLEQDASLPLTTETLPTVIKDDLNSYQDDDDVTVMGDEECETTQLYATATPPRQFQRTVVPAPESACRHADQMHQSQVSPHVSLAVNQRRLSAHSTAVTYDMRRDDRAAAVQDTRTVPTTHNKTVVQRAGVLPHSPVSYRTMYVCNIDECNRGFAYKKNLLTHQHSKHSSSSQYH